MYPVIIAKNEDQTREVRKLLEKGGFYVKDIPLGYATFVDGEIISWLDKKTLYGIICYAVEQKNEIITADEFLNNPQIIKGWKEPTPEIMHKIDGKDFSEATIKNALKDQCKWE